ncbi:glucose-6-phosphate dehydrogenase [Thermoactinomyces mirandus]|uniref:Glucose-6-phosphate 1-dehydrogenase n=1 Tax=Thermoactinomyces mirandus TaxID=2756294 RepID=A0A7W1XPM1_9BACL|nr:glucose-6-phosphate dehydrogenase [Thermoactinomyces mirandus]MBA4600866.1 glucose-6-phosphate dehydrogenase [Thermoactinomyces mirandus]
MTQTRMADPFSLVIFGATGDLAKRKLFPAMFNLFKSRILPDHFLIVGVGRSIRTVDAFRQAVRNSVENYSRFQIDSEAEWSEFVRHFQYTSSDIHDDQGYREMKGIIEEHEKQLEVTFNRLFYLAIAPGLFATVSQKLKASGLAAANGYKRLIIEKPIGHDYESARELNKQIKRTFEEEEIYRIDHYLGKEMIQNIEVIRFANSLFEPLWNHRYIESVQITASETVGVEERANYYDRAGALRDMVQNHLLQMLMMVCMEPPSRLKTEAIHDEKIKVLRSLRRYGEDEVGKYFVRAQYREGKMNGKRVPAYRDEPGIDKNSMTETFVAAKLYVDNLRWAEVPFYIRTGKRMAEKVTKIIVQFKDMPKNLYFNRDNDLKPNILEISIHPEEGIKLFLNAKKPGTDNQITPIAMEYCNNCEEETPEAYESLIYDAIIGDQTYFTHWAEVALAWKFIDPVRRLWDQDPQSLQFYDSGTWGPKKAHELLAQEGHGWWPQYSGAQPEIIKANELPFK